MGEVVRLKGSGGTGHADELKKLSRNTMANATLYTTIAGNDDKGVIEDFASYVVKHAQSLRMQMYYPHCRILKEGAPEEKPVLIFIGDGTAEVTSAGRTVTRPVCLRSSMIHVEVQNLFEVLFFDI